MSLVHSFKKSGIQYSLIKREGRVVIYMLKHGECIYYEVFLIRVHSGRRRLVQGKVVVDSAEAYARPSDFGFSAYSCRKLSDAEARFAELKARSEAGKK